MDQGTHEEEMGDGAPGCSTKKQCCLETWVLDLSLARGPRA